MSALGRRMYVLMRRSRWFLTMVIMTVLSLAAGCSRDSNESKSQTGGEFLVATRNTTLDRILEIRIPTAISILENQFGQPNSIELPDENDPSPWGQWFEWSRPDGSTLRALADDYDPASANHHADVRLIEIRAPERNRTTRTIHGFALNHTKRTDVEKSLGSLQQSSLHERSELDVNDVYRDSVKIENDGLYTYFLFESDGHLIGVVQASLDMDYAD